MFKVIQGSNILIEPLESRRHLSASSDSPLPTPPAPISKIVRSSTYINKAVYASAATVIGHRAFILSAGTVNIYNSVTGRWSASYLSQPRGGVAAVSVGNVALFAGGVGPSPYYTDLVDIYDDATRQWSTSHIGFLSGRNLMAGAAAGNKAVFVGGFTQIDSPEYGLTGGAYTGAAHIYDTDTKQWATVTLPVRLGYAAGTTVGHKAVFYGERTSAIYDADTGLWTTADMPSPFFGASATTAGDKAIFTGSDGSVAFQANTDIIQIYDGATGLWSTQTLSVARSAPIAATLGTSVLIAGGVIENGIPDGATTSDIVDVYDSSTGTWSTTRLSQPRFGMIGVTVGNQALFVAGTAILPVPQHPDLVDFFSIDQTAPAAALVSAPTLKRSLGAYTFTVAYHDAYRVATGTLDDSDIIVTGPNGFSAPAHLISESPGRHRTTRVARYAITPGRRWQPSDNGVYTIHLQDNQVTDVVENAVNGQKLGRFTIAIPDRALPQQSRPPFATNGPVIHEIRTTAADQTQKVKELLRGIDGEAVTCLYSARARFGCSYRR